MAARCPLIIFLCVTCGLLTAGAMPFGGGMMCSGCPEGWTLFESHCYRFFTRKLSWTDAELTCVDLGGNLASVHSDAGNDFLRDLTTEAAGKVVHAWIGGFNAVQEGMWMWTDGSKPDYQKWGPGKPNNADVEHCLLMNWEEKFWNDGQCSWTLPFVCSKQMVMVMKTQ